MVFYALLAAKPIHFGGFSARRRFRGKVSSSREALSVTRGTDFDIS
jgi:hypothetical protein